MSLDQAKLLFGFLTLLTNVLVVWIAVMWLGSRFSSRIAGLRLATIETLRGAAVPLAFLIASGATLGSLYLSEIANLAPCRLCWFQRIAIYPLMVVFGVAWFRKNASAWMYGIPLAIMGMGVSGYHFFLQRFPSFEGAACEFGVPCSAIYFEVFGFMTIPYMAVSSTVAILALSAVALAKSTSVRDSEPAAHGE
jgi:disulfide bond formation protein DsbB